MPKAWKLLPPPPPPHTQPTHPNMHACPGVHRHSHPTHIDCVTALPTLPTHAHPPPSCCVRASLRTTLMRRWRSPQTRSPTCPCASRARPSGTHPQSGRPGGQQWQQQPQPPAWPTVLQHWPSMQSSRCSAWRRRLRVGPSRSSCRRQQHSSSRLAAAGEGPGASRGRARLVDVREGLSVSCVRSAQPKLLRRGGRPRNASIWELGRSRT